jgi:hypothetical protein
MTTSELAHLARALKAPRIRRAAAPLAERVRAEGWPYERYLAAVLEEEVLARETSGGRCASRPPGCRRSRPWTTSTSASNARSASR